MDTLLLLSVAPEQEDDLIDYLLESEGLSAFTSWPAFGHDQVGFATLAEQVAGRRKRIMVQIALPSTSVAAVLQGLATRVGKDIRWWQQRIEASGHIA